MVWITNPITGLTWVCVAGYVPLVVGMAFFIIRGLIRWNNSHIFENLWYPQIWWEEERKNG